MQVRNKQPSKRDTEKQVKEIWRAKMEENKAGKQPQELADFIFGYFLKGKGLMSAVVEVSLGLAVRSVASSTLHSASWVRNHWMQSKRPQERRPQKFWQHNPFL